METKIAGLSAKFDKSLALIEEDKRLVATYQKELQGECGWVSGQASVPVEECASSLGSCRPAASAVFGMHAAVAGTPEAPLL